jgi:hypothetical protein
VSEYLTISLSGTVRSIFTEETSLVGKTLTMELSSTSSSTDGLEENGTFYFTVVDCSSAYVTIDSPGSGWLNLQGTSAADRLILFS